MQKNGFAPISMIIVAVGIVVFAVGGWLYVTLQLARNQIQRDQLTLNTRAVPGASAVLTTSSPFQAEEPPSPGAMETSKWNTYTNTAYGFSIRYPDGFEIGPSGVFQETDDAVVVGSNNNPHEQIFINIADVASREHSFYFYELPPSFVAGDFTTVVQNIWQLAKEEDGVTGPITASTIAGQPAYQFPVTKGIGLNGFGRVIDEKHLWIFLKHNDDIFDISLPNKDSFLQILQTLSFTK